MKPKTGSGLRRLRNVIDTLLACGVLYLLVAIMTTALDRAQRRTSLRLLVGEASDIYDAFDRYSVRNHGFPAAYDQAALDLESLDPLRKRGYYDGPVRLMLHDRRADAYNAPSDQGPQREFWLELTLRGDPSTRVLIARSDDAPLSGGQWLDGVFVFRDGEMVDQNR